MTAREFEFPFQGRTLAGKRWGTEGGIPILALHGWLDNANSFDLIAPHLRGFDIVAMDFAGHGLSDHRPRHTPYLGLLDIQDVIAVADHLEWQQFSLLSHSFGAELSAHIIGLYPQRVLRLLALDGFAESVGHAKWLEAHREVIDRNVNGKTGTLRVFPDQEQMALGVAKATGQSISSARILIERGSRQVEGGYTWRSDSRVRWADELGLPHEQLEHNVAAFEGEILLVEARHGLQWYRSGVELLADKYAHLNVVELDGSHHLHMDDDITQLIELTQKFLAQTAAVIDAPEISSTGG